MTRRNFIKRTNTILVRNFVKRILTAPSPSLNYRALSVAMSSAPLVVGRELAACRAVEVDAVVGAVVAVGQQNRGDRDRSSQVLDHRGPRTGGATVGKELHLQRHGRAVVEGGVGR